MHNASQINVTLEYKTSQFFKIEIYASSDSWINNISIDVWFIMIGQYLKIWNLRMQKNLDIEEIIFKVVQMEFLAMHITNQKISFDLYTVGNLLNIFLEHDLNILMIFGIQLKSIFWPIQCIFSYCYKHTPSTSDWFCAPGSEICCKMKTQA